MIDANEFFDAGVQLHGHRCAPMALGLRVGAAAMNQLGVGRSQDRQLLALVELGNDHCGHCFADGVQMITGCTLGKGNITKLGYGKFGLTLVDQTSGRAVRVVPRAEAQVKTKRTPFFQQFCVGGVPASEVPGEVVDPPITRVLHAPGDELLVVSDVFDYTMPAVEHTFHSFICDRCGELVVEPYGRVVGTHKVCIPCHRELLAAERAAG